MGVVGVAKDIYLEKFGLDATTFSFLVGSLQTVTPEGTQILSFASSQVIDDNMGKTYLLIF